jgi:hypothetical protein
MPITNPQAIAFTNNLGRRAADRMAQAYYLAKITLNEWNGSGISALIGVGGGVIRDSASPTDDVGTGGDGRHVITGNDINVLINQLQAVVTDFEASTNTKLNAYLKPAVNPSNG